MANDILEKFGASTEIVITLASLASSTVGLGRQGTIVDNTLITARFRDILIWAFVKQGTNPTGSRKAVLYLIRDDNNGHRDDGAGTSDAAITILNASIINVGINKSSPATGEVIYIPSAIIHRPGPKWTVALTHDTAVNLDSTENNSRVFFIGLNPEIQ